MACVAIIDLVFETSKVHKCWPEVTGVEHHHKHPINSLHPLSLHPIYNRSRCKSQHLPSQPFWHSHLPLRPRHSRHVRTPSKTGKSPASKATHPQVVQEVTHGQQSLPTSPTPIQSTWVQQSQMAHPSPYPPVAKASYVSSAPPIYHKD
jgi:hypothetical protein